MKMNPKILFAGLALTSLVTAQTAVASLTTQGWWHYGESPTIQTDSSGNGRNFALGFSCAGSGNPGAGVASFGAGGPLGPTGYVSTNSLYWTPLHCGAAAMWNPWGSSDVAAEWNPQPTNYVIECWILPEDIGSSPNRTWFFGSGSGDFSQPTRPSRTGAGGVYFVWDKTAGPGGGAGIGAFVIANAGQGVPTEVQIGDFVDADFTKWMHVAVVNDNGTNTFYVNGVKRGASTTSNTIPNGNIFAGGSPGTSPSFHGWLDELRISTFAPGAFVITDLLTRPAGPGINVQPQSATVWNGGDAPFTVVAAFDTSLTYQWQRAGTNLAGETAATLVLPQVSLADSGTQVRCILTASSISVTSSVATLTVVPNRTDDVNFYRAAVTGTPGVAAYFPVDNCLATTLSNIVDVTRNGTLEGGVMYDSRTNRSYGQRGVTFSGAGDVQIPNNPAFEFAGGNGTIEALIYLDRGSQQDDTIFAWAADGGAIGYALMANKDGSTLIYTNDSPVGLSWSVPANLLGRLAHVALVIENNTNVTAILDGQSLGTKSQPGFGPAGGSPAWIGAVGTSLFKPFNGTIDEVSVYGTALSLNTIQVHYSRYVYGTNVSPPSIVSQSGARTVLAGAAPILKVSVAGTLPISYQWTSNGIAIPGATASKLKVVSSAASTSANFVLWATNAIGWTNSQAIPITFTAAPSAYSTAVLTDHPIGYWRLDEASGTNVVDFAGYNDSTYIGTVLYGASSVIATETDKAVDFSNLSGRAQLSNVPELNPAGAFSLEVWTRPNAGAGGVIVASQNRNNSRGGYSLHANFFSAEYGIDLGAPNASVTRYVSTTLPATGVPVHLVFTWDGVSPQGTLYVNGSKNSTPAGGFAANMSSFVNNTVAPLTFGKRSDNAVPWNGIVDEVAFYDYALSDARVTNHWSFSWLASSITNQPVGVTNVEGSTVSLTVGAAGYPNTYQWYKVGSGALTEVSNFDGTRHYPNGVTNATLTIAQCTPADSGLYNVVIGNALGGSTSVNATVLITPDTNAPVVAAVLGLGTPNNSGPTPYLVKVIFNKRVDPNTAGDPSKYSFSPAVTVNSVTFLTDIAMAPLGGDWRTAYLNTTGLTPGQKYALTVTGVKDQAQTPNTIVPAAKYFRAPLLSVGAANWDYYYVAATVGSGVSRLQSDVNYPNAPQTNAIANVFNSGALYSGNDLNNNPAFGALGDNYGSVLSAWITPTVSGDYTFFLASDDASQLYLSPSADPALAALIAEEATCCHPFMEPVYGMPQTSGPQTLTAGVPYFIKALHSEGGGGDWVKVAWRISTDTSNSTNLPPIASSFLSAYAPVAQPVFGTASLSGGTMTIPWTGYQGILEESTDLQTWTAVPGNPNPLVVTVSSAPKKFYRIAQ